MYGHLGNRALSPRSGEAGNAAPVAGSPITCLDVPAQVSPWLVLDSSNVRHSSKVNPSTLGRPSSKKVQHLTRRCHDTDRVERSGTGNLLTVAGRALAAWSPQVRTVRIPAGTFANM